MICAFVVPFLEVQLFEWVEWVAWVVWVLATMAVHVYRRDFELARAAYVCARDRRENMPCKRMFPGGSIRSAKVIISNYDTKHYC